MRRDLMDILACPVCKGPLQWHRETSEFVCRADRLAYPVRDGIPNLLPPDMRRAMEAEAGRP